MPVFDTITADSVIVALIATLALREAMIAFLPSSVVGPEGWLLRIDGRD
ncbi:hypothetical protein [Sinisalibacter aestuarii]|uniref:Uncharacterized protein n=1 Tax=Sinisalibacter aestuarii TaxID=2949426 RepID=A0ABQ5LQA4_9RHOB|nr:hypothetical protein [Sinisalibacter aestuarii]GKY87182.1 hypothetical protein STA1M1_10510 [Sinisalibacter aestuarii]